MKTKIVTLIFIALAITAFSQSKQQQLTGTVKDNQSGEPLVGVVLQIQGSDKAVTTDLNGKFSLSTAGNPPFTLKASYSGYEKEEFVIESAEDELNLDLRSKANILNKIVVTASRRKETVQEVPIPISVVTGASAAETGSFNVNRLKELIPSVQLYSSNPRNTGLSIRGLGTTFGLTNDGIDPGVGFYVDGVYYARTAATTLDFIDIEQIEVLRGPQGTLFGKNTTAGAFNITSLKPRFTPGATFEMSYGNYGYIQSKTSVTGPLSKKLAARLSFSGTQRDGLLYNTTTQKNVNDINNLGVRGQLLYKPTEKIDITLAADASRQRPDGYAQVFAGVAPTERDAFRQYNQIAKDLNYSVPSTNPFDRKIDTDTPWKSNQDFGGVSLNAEIQLGKGTLTSTTAWRYWNWDPSSDRDFTGLQGLKLSQAPSKHQQYSQEIRWAGELSSKLSAVFGVFAFGQNLKSDPVQTEESGKDTWRFQMTKATDVLWKTPGLLDGYGINTTSNLKTISGALFSQLNWQISKKWSVLPGLRLNYDKKEVDFKRETYGGLQTADAALLKLKTTVYSNQSFNANVNDTKFSGQLTLAYKPAKNVNSFLTYSTSFKPVGLNLGGIPTNTDGTPNLELAVIKPEKVNHVEFGIKTSPTATSVLNFTVYNSDIKDYQTQVQSPELGVNRGFLANAEKARVTGAELEGSVKLFKFLSLNASVAYTDGKYVTFKNAPLPLEETGHKDAAGKSVYFKDISGAVLPGISKWASSFGTELTQKGKFLNQEGSYFFAIDGYFRSEFSSNPTPSKYLVVKPYTLANARIGFRASEGVTIFGWSRNLFNKNYFEQLLPGAGNSGQYAGVLGDPRTYGVTLRYAF